MILVEETSTFTRSMLTEQVWNESPSTRPLMDSPCSRVMARSWCLHQIGTQRSKEIPTYSSPTGSSDLLQARPCQRFHMNSQLMALPGDKAPYFKKHHENKTILSPIFDAITRNDFRCSAATNSGSINSGPESSPAAH